MRNKFFGVDEGDNEKEQKLNSSLIIAYEKEAIKNV